ncbi:unnamed protein product [Taenia asiatica]|uniref:Salivary lipocalin n=1 Tax=Taenia asiatica TaxID=60517 RepID=A0A0R3W7X7_TAEAS|nr:unnamed protein product [Taenia asiatica]
MAVLMSTVCYASLNSYAYGPPKYKEGILLSDEDDDAQQPSMYFRITYTGHFFLNRFFFCLVESTNTSTSVRVFRVNYKNYIYSLEPTEFELFPKVPSIEENRNKDGLPESPLTQSLKSRLEEIKVRNC